MHAPRDEDRVTTKPSVEALIQQAQTAEREGRRDDARSLYERALYSLKRAHDGRVASSLLRWVGRTYQLDADVDTAMDCLEAAIAVGELTGDAAAIGHAINVQGNVEQQLGHLDQAEALYLQARSHAIDSGETRLAAMTAAERAELPGVSDDRAGQLLAGALVAEGAMDLFGVERLEICPWALREGVILRRLDHMDTGSAPAPAGVRRSAEADRHGCRLA